MKKVVIFIALWLFSAPITWACDLCERNQPEVLQDVSHGTGPQGQWDMVITWTAVVIVAVTLFFSIKFLVKPGEKRADHIKNLVVNANPHEI